LIPKYRRQVTYGKIKGDIEQIIRKLCEWKGVASIETEGISEPYTYVGAHTARNKRIKFYGIFKKAGKAAL